MTQLTWDNQRIAAFYRTIPTTKLKFSQRFKCTICQVARYCCQRFYSQKRCKIFLKKR